TEKCAEGSNLPATPYRVKALPSRARRLWHRMLRNAAEVIVMASGGARNRSGPSPDLSSGRSDRRGLSLSALPNEGYRGEAPEWPLGMLAQDELGVTRREREVWAEAWRSPQAAAWAVESWRWPIVAEYCRLKATVEAAPGASAALVSQLHRYRDQIGLTPAGLKENGWQIATVQVGSGETERSRSEKRPAGRARDRLKVASGGGY